MHTTASRWRRIRAILLAGLSAVLCACNTVEPWERGNLASPQMTEEPADRTVRDHIYRSREGTAGPASAKGGGCGCY
jgi:hypothetical protein